VSAFCFEDLCRHRGESIPLLKNPEEYVTEELYKRLGEEGEDNIYSSESRALIEELIIAYLLNKFAPCTDFADSTTLSKKPFIFPVISQKIPVSDTFSIFKKYFILLPELLTRLINPVFLNCLPRSGLSIYFGTTSTSLSPLVGI
jgi:hypothetical protein